MLVAIGNRQSRFPPLGAIKDCGEQRRKQRCCSHNQGAVTRSSCRRFSIGAVNADGGRPPRCCGENRSRRVTSKAASIDPWQRGDRLAFLPQWQARARESLVPQYDG
jgi:hypothetical protein